MMTGCQWLIISGRLGVDGHMSTGFWGGRGQTPGPPSIFYKAVFQANLLFGSETWVVTPRIGRTLGVFHNRMAHCLAVMKPKQNMAGRGGRNTPIWKQK